MKKHVHENGKAGDIELIMEANEQLLSVLKQMLQHKAISHTKETLKKGPLTDFVETANEAAKFVAVIVLKARNKKLKRNSK